MELDSLDVKIEFTRKTIRPGMITVKMLVDGQAQEEITRTTISYANLTAYLFRRWFFKAFPQIPEIWSIQDLIANNDLRLVKSWESDQSQTFRLYRAGKDIE